MIFNMTNGKMKTPVLSGSYPANVTVNAGTGAVFQVEIGEEGLPKAYTYQWYVNGAAVSGATSASYTRDTASDKGVYDVYCVVTNKAGSVTSRTALLTVQALPVLSGNYPANATVTVQNSTTCKVVIGTDGYPASYTYQWYKNGAAVSGATSASYSFTPTATGTVTVSCEVTNAAGTVTSRTATITVNPLYLYNSGTINTSLVGGLTACDYDYSGSAAPTTKPTVTKGTSSITLKVTISGDGVTGSQGCYFTNNKIDLTKYSKMKIKVTARTLANEESGRVRFGATSSKADEFEFAASKLISATGTISCDISSLSGSYYAAITFYSLDSKTITFSGWWLE